jgi:ligand-binding sensor domain-containing protein
MLRDNQGFMWFGTFVGINRYDGYQMEVFRNDNNDLSSQSENTIRTLYLPTIPSLFI